MTCFSFIFRSRNQTVGTSTSKTFDHPTCSQFPSKNVLKCIKKCFQSFLLNFVQTSNITSVAICLCVPKILRSFIVHSPDVTLHTHTNTQREKERCTYINLDKVLGGTWRSCIKMISPNVDQLKRWGVRLVLAHVGFISEPSANAAATFQARRFRQLVMWRFYL